MGRKRTERRDPMRVYALLACCGLTGSEDEVCERVMEAATAAGVDVDAIVGRPLSSARCGSLPWRRNRAAILSAVVADLLLSGRLGCIVAEPTAPQREPDGDRVVPGAADDENDGRPMRYDRIYAEPVRVSVGGEGGTVRYPPFDGRVRVEREGGRAIVAALDDLRESDRRSLARSPARRRLETHVRCTVPGCGQAFRAWISPPSARGGEVAVEDTAGDRISGCGFAGLFGALCPAHRRERRDRMPLWAVLRELGYRGRRDEVCAAVLTTADIAGIDVEAILRSVGGGEECPAWDSPEWGRLHERAVRALVKKLRADGNLDAIRPQ